MKSIELIYKNRDALLTATEKSNLSWKENIFWISMGYTFATPFYSLYMMRQVRQNPALKQAVTRRLLFLPLMSLFMITVSGRDMQSYSKNLADKYLGQLSDQ